MRRIKTVLPLIMVLLICSSGPLAVNAAGTYPGKGNVWIMLATGSEQTFVLKNDGTVWGYGYNAHGEVGNGNPSAFTGPVQLKGLKDVVSVASGLGAFNSMFSVALKKDGTVWGWGKQPRNVFGKGAPEICTAPVKIMGFSDIKAIAAGNSNIAALRKDGTVWCTGTNNWGQCGDGTRTDRTSPVQVKGLTDVVAIALNGNCTGAIKKDGTVWCWGLGAAKNGRDDALIPVQVAGLKDVVSICAGSNNMLALKKDGTVWGWGVNADGQLGDGTDTGRNSPVKVKGLDNVVYIGAGCRHSMARKKDGTFWMWGKNTYGQYGNKTKVSSRVPKKIDALKNTVYASGSMDFTSFIKADGTVWSMGYNGDGKFGVKEPKESLVPLKIMGTSLTPAEQTADDSKIAVDGSFEDWAGITPLIIDKAETNKKLTFDIKSVYAFSDAKYLNIAVKAVNLAEKPEFNSISILMVNPDNKEVNYKISLRPNERHYAIFKNENGKNTDSLHTEIVSADIVEAQIPLEYLGNPAKMSIHVQSVSGPPEFATFDELEGWYEVPKQ